MARTNSIQWNDQADLYLNPLQRDRYERGLELGIKGRVEADEYGTLWYVAGGHRKAVGTRDGGSPRLPHPAEESAAERNLDAPARPPKKSSKRRRK